MNFDSVAGAVGRIGTLFFPFLLGGGMAFLMNTLLRPLESAENGGSGGDSAVLTLPEFIYLFHLQLALGIRLAHGRNRPHGHAGLSEDTRMECQTGAEKERTPSTIH